MSGKIYTPEQVKNVLGRYETALFYFDDNITDANLPKYLQGNSVKCIAITQYDPGTYRIVWCNSDLEDISLDEYETIDVLKKEAEELYNIEGSKWIPIP